MTTSEMNYMLYGMMLICAVMAVFNALKHRRRGWSAVFLSAGFLVFGLVIYLYRTGAPESQVEGGAVLLFILLGADFMFRIGNPTDRKRK